MPVESIATRWKDDPSPSASHRRFRVDVERLRSGMFVAELDRPWLDTPFLIQGFMIDSDIELSTLQRYCKHVYVDLDRSVPEVARTIRSAGPFVDAASSHNGLDSRSFARAEPSAPVAPSRSDTAFVGEPDDESKPAEVRASRGSASEAAADAEDSENTAKPDEADSARSAHPSRRAYRIRADVQISRETRDRFRRLVRGVAVSADEPAAESLAQRALARLRGMLGRKDESGDPVAASPAAAPQPQLQAEIAQMLPPGTRPTLYVDREDFAAELPRARSALARGEEVLTAVASDIRNGKDVPIEAIEEAVDQMVESMVDNPDALLWVAQMREEHQQTYQHGVRVALYLMTLGRQLGFPRDLLGRLGMIGMLADVGKTKLPRALLEKPGMLNPAEYSIVKEHVRLGLEALSQGQSMPAEVELGIAQHHERLDGSGYPKGLKGDEISIYGRMSGIADSFAALCTPRAYANPLAPQDALMNLYQWADTSFHGPLVEQFVQAIGVFPVGSLVELSSGEIAVVVAHNRVRRLEPRVLLLTWPDKRPLPAPIEVDLLHQARDATTKALRVVRGLPSGAYGLKLRDYYADGLPDTRSGP